MARRRAADREDAAANALRTLLAPQTGLRNELVALQCRPRLHIVTLFFSTVLIGFCLFLIGLAVLIVVTPPAAARFLNSFASSAQAHYAEQALRMLVGAAAVNLANSMWYPDLFRAFGWLVIGTTVGLLLIPWQWHHRFATRVMPSVIGHLRLFALGAAALGGFILYSLSRAVVH